LKESSSRQLTILVITLRCRSHWGPVGPAPTPKKRFSSMVCF